MAEDHTRSRQYDYTSFSNLVLEADRETRRRPNEATGEVESLVGKMNYKMGDKVANHARRPKELEEKLKRLHEKRQLEGSTANDCRKKHKHEYSSSSSFFSSSDRKNTSILTETQENLNLLYHPTTPESRKAYDFILGKVSQCLGSQPYEILASAAEEILSILKNDSYRDPEKQAEAMKICSSLSTHEFSQMVEYGKQIHDFNTSNTTSDENLENQNEKDDDLRHMANEQTQDMEMGVAVVFDEDDSEDESDHVDEVQDAEDEDGDDDDDQAQRKENHKMRLKGDHEQDEDEEQKDLLDVQKVDAYWLQRQLSTFYADAELSAKRAEEVLAILEKEDTLIACENQLVLLLDYDKFDFIKLVLRNRAQVLFGTRWNQAQTEEEKQQVEERMKTDCPHILQQLKQTSSAESWMQDRMGALEHTSRREARNLRKMQEEKNQEEDEVTTSKEAMTSGSRQGGQGTAAASAMSMTATLNLEALAFTGPGSHVMSNKECRLPEGTWRTQKQGYEEVHVPAIKSSSQQQIELIHIQEKLPTWTHAAFKNMTTLNQVQSKMFPAAFQSDENLLLCAPTGAGKTNVAVLTILHEIQKARHEDGGTLDLDAFKIVYIAPMKALVQEVVINFTQRFTEAYGIQVKELSGDQSLTREQIFSTQIIVTTPEKWDIITRKSGDQRTYTQLVKCIIIDEIHLLHDDRGAVLEAVIARTLRQIETTQEMVRLVGLSATLPNYEDVATFLRVDASKGLFYFDSSFRPVPLQQQYIGIKEKKAIKRFQLMNTICYEKVVDQVKQDNQVLIFVHSRKETMLTATALRDLCLERDEMSLFLQDRSASREILQSEAEKHIQNKQLAGILPFGFAVHHAGLSRNDRTLVEELFADGHLRVLCSTSTLAWGVNLPAHTVIIKGTQMYNAEEGKFTEINSLDILQMLGRAGRIQYDTQGEGIILTQHSELKFYLSLMNQQLPVESQLLKTLADHLNAEIVLGSIQNLDQGAQWLGYTYLYVRMLRAPQVYGISAEEWEENMKSAALASDQGGAAASQGHLFQYRLKLIHAAATLLAKHHLIKYDRRSGGFQMTPLGKIASHYYIVHPSISIYNMHFKSNMNEIELFRLFSMSYEFRHLVVRPEEKLELEKLVERVPIPIKEMLQPASNGAMMKSQSSGGAAKVNVLLQAYISHLKLDGFALIADMVHIYQSASRILRALFEMALIRGWATVAKKLLRLCQMVDRRMWYSQTPFRQFNAILSSSGGSRDKKLDEKSIRQLEKKDVPFQRYFDLSLDDLMQLMGTGGSGSSSGAKKQMGKQLLTYLHQFPKVHLSAHVQPITRSLVQLELLLRPDFKWNEELHGRQQVFWLFVTDVDGEDLIYYQSVVIKAQDVHEEKHVAFTLPLFDPLPPLYYLHFISDRWLHAEMTLPISFQSLILPQKQFAHTPVLDLQPIALSSILGPSSSSSFSYLNAIQTQVYPTLTMKAEPTTFVSSSLKKNCFVAAPVGSGKSTCIELLLSEYAAAKAKTGASSVKKWIYVLPVAEFISSKLQLWKNTKMKHEWSNVSFGRLQGYDTLDHLEIIQTHDVVFTTPHEWDRVTRRWRQRQHIFASIEVMILDQMHFIGNGKIGALYEMIVSRMRFITSQLMSKKDEVAIRLMGFSNSIGNGNDIGDWIGCNTSSSSSSSSVKENSCFSFHSNVRPIPLETHVFGYDIDHFSSRLLAMSKPMYQSLNHYHHDNVLRSGAQVLIYVPSIQQSQLTAIDMVTYAAADPDMTKAWTLNPSIERYMTQLDLVEPHDEHQVEILLQVMKFGIGYVNETFSKHLKDRVVECYTRGWIYALVLPHSMCYELEYLTCATVVILETQYFDPIHHNFCHYSIATLAQMLGQATDTRHALASATTALIYCHRSRKSFIKQFLYHPLPIESHLDHYYLADALNSEIVHQTIASRQDAVDYLTWTFMYRRVLKNPNYYNLHGQSFAHLSDYLSELVESTLQLLEESKCISLPTTSEDAMDVGDMEENEESEDMEGLNLGRIAAHYAVEYTTIELFATCLSAEVAAKGMKTYQILEILSNALEFQDQIKLLSKNESQALVALEDQMHLENQFPRISSSKSSTTIQRKVLILLYAHVTQSLSTSSSSLVQAWHHHWLEHDLALILPFTLHLAYAMIDILSSLEILKPVLVVMDCCQLIVQGVWKKKKNLPQGATSALMNFFQLPFMSMDILSRIQDFEPTTTGNDDDDDEMMEALETPVDLLSLSEDAREAIFQFDDPRKMSAVAMFCNQFPDLTLSYGVRNSTSPKDLNLDTYVVERFSEEEGAPEDSEEDQVLIQLVIHLEREVLQSSQRPCLSLAPLYPEKKKEFWWIVVGSPEQNRLLSIKRFSFRQDEAQKNVNVQFELLKNSKPSDVTTYLICDSYLGCDLENEFSIQV